MAELQPQLAIIIVQAGDRGQLGMEDFRSPPARHVSKRRVQCSRDSFGCHAEFKRNDIRPQVVIGTGGGPTDAAPHHRLPDPSHRSHPSTHACSGVRTIVRAGRAAVNAGETYPIGLEIGSPSYRRRRYRRARRLEWDAFRCRAGPGESHSEPLACPDVILSHPASYHRTKAGRCPLSVAVGRWYLWIEFHGIG
jgi:hypothetical protein